MHLVNDYQSDQVDVCSVAALPCDDIPLLWRRHNDVRLFDLLLGEMHVSCELLHLDPERLETSLKVTNYFGDKGFHWCNIDDL